MDIVNGIDFQRALHMLCLAVIDQHEVGATACDTSSEGTTFTTKEDTKFSNEYCPRGTVFIIEYCTRGEDAHGGGGGGRKKRENLVRGNDLAGSLCH